MHTYTAGILGGQRASKVLPNSESFVPGPLPQGFKTDAAAKYADVGDGLSIGVRADSSASSTVYTLRLGTHGARISTVRVYLLSQGISLANGIQSKDLTDVCYTGRCRWAARPRSRSK